MTPDAEARRMVFALDVARLHIEQRLYGKDHTTVSRMTKVFEDRKTKATADICAFSMMSFPYENDTEQFHYTMRNLAMREAAYARNKSQEASSESV